MKLLVDAAIFTASATGAGIVTLVSAPLIFATAVMQLRDRDRKRAEAQRRHPAGKALPAQDAPTYVLAHRHPFGFDHAEDFELWDDEVEAQ